MTGQTMYEAYRTSMKRAAYNRGLTSEPRWKDLKPWVARVWERAAASLGEGVYGTCNACWEREWLPTQDSAPPDETGDRNG